MDDKIPQSKSTKLTKGKKEAKMNSNNKTRSSLYFPMLHKMRKWGTKDKHMS